MRYIPGIKFQINGGEISFPKDSYGYNILDYVYLSLCTIDSSGVTKTTDYVSAYDTTNYIICQWVVDTDSDAVEISLQSFGDAIKSVEYSLRINHPKYKPVTTGYLTTYTSQGNAMAADPITIDLESASFTKFWYTHLNFTDSGGNAIEIFASELSAKYYLMGSWYPVDCYRNCFDGCYYLRTQEADPNIYMMSDTMDVLITVNHPGYIPRTVRVTAGGSTSGAMDSSLYELYVSLTTYTVVLYPDTISGHLERIKQSSDDILTAIKGKLGYSYVYYFDESDIHIDQFPELITHI